MSNITLETNLNNKAITIYMNNATYYFSYTTLVMVHYNGEYLINNHYWKYSVTTSKHFNFWLDDALYSILNKDDFEEMLKTIGD